MNNNSCTCRSSFQTGMCQWCIDEYSKVYDRYLTKNEKCLFDNVQKGEVTNLVCTCPKCFVKCNGN